MAVTHAHRNGWDKAKDGPCRATRRGHPGLLRIISQTDRSPFFLSSTTADTVPEGDEVPMSPGLHGSSEGARC